VALLLVGLGLSLGALGCQETRMSGYHRRLPPKPRPLRPAPPDALTDALVLNVSAAPLDTNANGYPDLIHATAHLFDTRYYPSIREDGAFVFVLYAAGEVGDPEAEPLRLWRIADERLERAHARSGFGDCYRFKLSLLEDGGDILPISMGDIVCRFEPTDGRSPVYAGEVSSIQIGRRVLVPQLKWRQVTEPAAEADGQS
jgi:hypothetical protein